MDDGEYYWDWLKYEDNLFTNRNNLLLVAESMTFGAVATIQAGTGKSAHGILLAAAGLFITLIWLFASLIPSSYSNATNSLANLLIL